MPKFIVQWRYRSNLAGPWVEGEVVELDEGLATAVNHDSPGVLVAYVKPAEPETRAPEAPAKDRMMKGKAKR